MSLSANETKTSHRSAPDRRFLRILAAAAILAALTYMGYARRQRTMEDLDRRAAARRAEILAEVRAGENGERVAVTDATLLESLANDPACVANLTQLTLADMDLSGTPAAARKLVNVKSVVFYSCTDADKLLTAMKGMPAIEQIHFEVTRLSDEGAELLTTFPNLKKVHFEQIVGKAREDLLKERLPRVQVEIPFPEANEP